MKNIRDRILREESLERWVKTFLECFSQSPTIKSRFFKEWGKIRAIEIPTFFGLNLSEEEKIRFGRIFYDLVVIRKLEKLLMELEKDFILDLITEEEYVVLVEVLQARYLYFNEIGEGDLAREVTIGYIARQDPRLRGWSLEEIAEKGMTLRDFDRKMTYRHEKKPSSVDKDFLDEVSYLNKLGLVDFGGRKPSIKKDFLKRRGIFLRKYFLKRKGVLRDKK